LGNDAAHFVLTSKPPASTPKGNMAFTFVTDGIASALEQARAAAGERNVAIGGGPSTAQGFVEAGVLDEIQIHLIPVLLGEGIRLFGQAGGRLALAPIRVIEAPDATHLKYRVVR
jgi:dihydrofolate reductase